MVGVDFNEIIVPMAKFIIVGFIIAIGAPIFWEVHQLYVNETILNGVMELEIYMDQPEGFIQKRMNTLYANSRKLCTVSCILL